MRIQSYRGKCSTTPTRRLVYPVPHHLPADRAPDLVTVIISLGRVTLQNSLQTCADVVLQESRERYSTQRVPFLQKLGRPDPHLTDKVIHRLRDVSGSHLGTKVFQLRASPSLVQARCVRVELSRKLPSRYIPVEQMAKLNQHVRLSRHRRGSPDANYQTSWIRLSTKSAYACSSSAGSASSGDVLNRTLTTSRRMPWYPSSTRRSSATLSPAESGSVTT